MESEYRLIIAGAKGDSKIQQLAAQFIPKFFKSFPEAQLQAVEAQLDLCEAEELPVIHLASPADSLSQECFLDPCIAGN